MDELTRPGSFTVELGGVVFHVPARCPHRGGLLRCGYFNAKSGRITCPMHGATFALKTGKRVTGPECRDLAPATEEDADVGQDPAV